MSLDLKCFLSLALLVKWVPLIKLDFRKHHPLVIKKKHLRSRSNFPPLRVWPNHSVPLYMQVLHFDVSNAAVIDKNDFNDVDKRPNCYGQKTRPGYFPKQHN